MMIGETKLGYQITELVGQGGFGTVYKAVKKNKAMETVRALKHISLPSRKQWTDIYNSMGNDMVRTDEYFDGILQEILNEIRILADLTSKGVKNVVWYYENEIEDTPSPKHYDIYLLMEYLTALPNYIETHEIKVKDVIKIGTDILSALIECHKRKIIHRDIKTDNIFVSDEGDFKLGDFGVSKKLSDRSRATSMKGTPNYIAPEVYLGEPYDASVDLYSLGIVLYRLLNYNRNPFMPEYPASYDSEDEDKAFELRMKGETPSYPAFAVGEFGDIILKSISNKDNRFKSAAEFKEALENVASTMTEEELNTVVLENVLADVDFSTFGSKNELTSMVSNNSINAYKDSSISNNSFSVSELNVATKKSKARIIIPLVAVLGIAIAIGAFFMLKDGGINHGGKFVEVDGISKFLKSDGKYAQNEWVFYDNNEYYFNGRQSLVINDSVDFNGKTYYVNKEGAKIINDWYKAQDGKQYYLDDNGEPYKSTAKTINGVVAFFNNKGERIINDWATYEGDYYFVDSEGELIKNSFKTFGYNEWYYLGSDGKMIKGTFYDVNGKTYYFDNNGKLKMSTLFDTDDSTYYAEEDGSITKGGWTKNNQFYTDSEGRILKNTTVDGGVKLDSNGLRIQETTAYIAPSYVYDSNAPIVAQDIEPTEAMVGQQLGAGYSNQNSNSSIKLPEASNSSNVTYSGNVVWGEVLRYSNNISGNGRITINISKVKPDGSAEVEELNRAIEELFEAVCERAMSESNFVSFVVSKSSIETVSTSRVVISYVGEIKREGNKKKGVRYRVTLDRDRGIALFDKVT